MTVKAVGQNENSQLTTVASSTALGAVGGYSLKYLLPITKQENSLSKRSMLNYCRKVTNRAQAAEFRAAGVQTPAQDLFVKMIAENNKDAFTTKSLSMKIKALGGEDSLAGKEFKNIIRNVNESSKTLTKNMRKAYYIMLKKIRPTIPFVVAGAGVGFLAGFANNVFKTEA